MLLRCSAAVTTENRLTSRQSDPVAPPLLKACLPRRAFLTLLGSSGGAILVKSASAEGALFSAPSPAAEGLPASSSLSAQQAAPETQLSRAVGPAVDAPPLAEAPVRLEDRVPMNAALAPVSSESEKPTSTPVSDKEDKAKPAAQQVENGGKTQQQVEEEERKRQRRRKRGRIKELEELRAELAQKQRAVVENEQELLTKEQTTEVLKEELAMERKLRSLLTKELKQAEEEAVLAMGLCGAGTLIP